MGNYCERCGQNWIVHDGDGSCARDYPKVPDLATCEDLFDLFVAHGVTIGEIAAMVILGIERIERQIHELRVGPDDLPYTDREIAEGIMRYCEAEIAIAKAGV